jgi:hypothetical protein
MYGRDEAVRAHLCHYKLENNRSTNFGFAVHCIYFLVCNQSGSGRCICRFTPCQSYRPSRSNWYYPVCRSGFLGLSLALGIGNWRCRRFSRERDGIFLVGEGCRERSRYSHGHVIRCLGNNVIGLRVRCGSTFSSSQILETLRRLFRSARTAQSVTGKTCNGTAHGTLATE